MDRWSRTLRHRIAHIRDRIMRGLGTAEPLIEEVLSEALTLREFGRMPVSVSWRKPLRLDEINQLAPTAEVRARPGRP